MISERQTRIFKAIVEEFIATAEPVGSKTLVEKYDLAYSTATIRNEMAFLEEEGLLEKTHTSSGRIPSTQGYRYYVENFLQERLDENLALTVKSAFDVSNLNTSEAIKMSCDILSSMTNLTSMVLGPDAQQQKLQHIKLFPVDERSAVAVFITDSGHTENRMFRFEEDVSISDIENCCEILNDRLQGTMISEVVEKMNSIKPILAAAVERHEILFKAFVDAFVKFASENIYLSGQSNILYQPEFADINRLKKMMSMLENSDMMRSIVEGKDALMLKTGENSQLVWKDDMAIVSSRFHMRGDEEAELMLVGPSRMNYDHVIGMLDAVANELEKLLNKGGRNGR